MQSKTLPETIPNRIACGNAPMPLLSGMCWGLQRITE